MCTELLYNFILKKNQRSHISICNSQFHGQRSSRPGIGNFWAYASTVFFRAAIFSIVSASDAKNSL